MPRRALIATIVTAAVGALMGVVFGALVGRVIALFGDETVQTSVPVIFCATLGFFVGGASTIKGSLERFGAKRAGAGTFVALVVLVLLVGGVSVMGRSAVIVIVSALVALALGSAAAVAVGQPENAPSHGLNAPRAARPATGADASVTPVASVRDRVAVPDKRVTASDPSPIRRPPAAGAARRVSTTPPPQDWATEDQTASALVSEERDDWVPEDEAAARPPREALSARPRRDRPLSRLDVSSNAPEPARLPTAAVRPTRKTSAAKKASVKKASVKKATPAKQAASTAKSASRTPAAPARHAGSTAKRPPGKSATPAAKAAPGKKTAAVKKAAPKRATATAKPAPAKKKR